MKLYSLDSKEYRCDERFRIFRSKNKAEISKKALANLDPNTKMRVIYLIADAD